MTNVISVLVISILFFMIFGVVGVNYFKGLYYTCNLGATSWSQVDSGTTMFYKQDCLNYGGEWQKTFQNFDNILSSMMTLFQISMLCSWSSVMYQGMSVTGIDSDVIVNFKAYNSVYFVVFVMIGAFFTLNLFVGIVISTYNREKDKLEKDYLLKEKQKEWLYAMKIIFR